MYVPYGNLTKTGSLLQSVYDQLDVYRGQLVDQDGGGSILKSSYHLPPSPTVSSTSASSSSSSNYLLLYSAVQQLAQKLSTAATSAVYNYTDITAIPYSPSSSSSYSTISPFSPTSPSSPSFSSSSTVDDLFSYTSSSSTSSPFSPSFFSPSITSITTTTTTTASSIWTTFMQSLPMPTDEATLVSELGLGPVRDPLYTAIPMTLLYVLILVTGVIGNLVTCVVIARNRYMHTATNYYLFSLAISDLLLLILGLPQEIQQIWRRYPYAFSEAFCILRGFSSEASTNSSVLTITAFTVERYVAICHPLRAHTMSKLSRAVKLIIIIWLLGFVCAAPIAYKFGIVFDYVHEEVLIPQSATCNVKRALPAFIDEHIFALQSLLVFVLPVTAISVLYVLIGLKLRQSSLSAKGNLGKLRRRPVKHKQGNENTENAGSGKPSALEKTASYFTSTSTESIENMTPPAVLKNGHKNGNGVAHHQGHLFNSNHNSNSNHRTLKEVANHFISQAHHHQQHQLSNGAQYIVHDHRQRGRLTKFTSSSSSASSGGGGCGGNGGSNSLSQRRQVIKMLTAVVVAFFVCFAPFHAQRLMAIYVKNPSSYEKVAFNTLTYISGVAYYLTATINPILYSIMSVRFRQAFHDTFVRTFCPSKSAIFQCTRQRTMSGMYNSMYYRASHPHIHHPLPAEVAAGGGDRGGGGGSGVRGPFGARSKSITAAAVIGAPINIVTHSIIKNVNGGVFGGGGGSGNQQKSLAFADNHQNHRMPSTLFEEEEGGVNLSSGERSEEIEEYHPHHQNSSNKALQHQVMQMNGGSGHHDSIGSDDLEGAWPPKTMNV